MGKIKLTLEQIKEKVLIMNSSIEILGEFTKDTGKTKKRIRRFIQCRCKLDNYEWDVELSNLLSGSGCKMCSGTVKLTIEQVKKTLKKINPNIEILSNEYTNAHTKLKCKCLIDGHKWDAKWSDLSQKKGCPKCSGKMKLNLEEVKEKLKEINPNIEILSTIYVDAHTKLKCECLIDGHIWNVEWNDLSQNRGCPVCGRKSQIEKRKLTLEEVKMKLKEVNPNIEVLSKTYINSHTKLKLKCLIDGCVWKSTWSDMAHKGSGCPKCRIEKISGENNPNWKGGVTPLQKYLREATISQWKQDSLKQYDYKCAITGSVINLNIHHLFNFSDILLKTLELTELPLYEEIGQYTNVELKLIEDTCLNIHYQYGLGIPLTKEIHDEYHNIYGKRNNTFEQFEEFRQYKLNSNIKQ